MTEAVIVTDTPALIAAIRARADKVNISRKDINVLAELAEGHAEKLLSEVPSRGIGLKVLWGLVEAVGCKVTLVEDPQAMARIAEYVGTRDQKQVRTGSILSAARMRKKQRLERLFNDPKYFNKLGRKGGTARAASLTEEQRTKIAIRANKVRWQRVKEQRRRTRNAPSSIETATSPQSCQAPTDTTGTQACATAAATTINPQSQCVAAIQKKEHRPFRPQRRQARGPARSESATTREQRAQNT